MKERKELAVGATHEEAASWEGYDAEKHEIVQCEETRLFQVFHRRRPSDRTIRKPIVRETRADFRHYKRKIVVTLLPGDVISMRLKGTKRRVVVEIHKLYERALQWEAFAQMNARRQAKVARRKPKKEVAA